MTTIPVDTSAIVDGQRVDAADVLTPIANLKTGIEQVIDGGYDFLKTLWVNPTLITIASDTIAVTQTRHLVQNEGAALTDLVSTISGQTMDFLMIQQGVSGQTTIFKHNTGNIWFEDERDYVLDDRNRILLLWWNSSAIKWYGINQNGGDIWLNNFANVTIATGSIAATRSKLFVAPETGSADDLDTISNGSNLSLVILAASGSNNITVRHNVGNIWFESGENFVLNTTNGALVLVWNDTVSKWVNITAYSLVPLGYRDVFYNTNPDTDFTTLEVPPYAYSQPAAKTISLEFLPRFLKRRLFWDEVVVSTTMAQMGLTMATTGTPSANPVTARQYVRFTSGAVIGNYANRRSTGDAFQWRWSPTFECVVDTIPGSGANQDNNPAWFGFMSATLPVVAAGPAVTYTGVSGVWLKPYTSGGTLWAGQVWSAGTKLGQVLLGTSSATLGILRIWIDGVNNNVYFEVNGERSAALPTTPGALASLGLNVFCGVATPAASAVLFDYACQYGEQN